MERSSPVRTTAILVGFLIFLKLLRLSFKILFNFLLRIVAMFVLAKFDIFYNFPIPVFEELNYRHKLARNLRKGLSY